MNHCGACAASLNGTHTHPPYWLLRSFSPSILRLMYEKKKSPGSGAVITELHSSYCLKCTQSRPNRCTEQKNPKMLCDLPSLHSAPTPEGKMKSVCRNPIMWSQCLTDTVGGEKRTVAIFRKLTLAMHHSATSLYLSLLNIAGSWQ